MRYFNFILIGSPRVSLIGIYFHGLLIILKTPSNLLNTNNVLHLSIRGGELLVSVKYFALTKSHAFHNRADIFELASNKLSPKGNVERF
jgi:hypothetical protein